MKKHLLVAILVTQVAMLYAQTEVNFYKKHFVYSALASGRNNYNIVTEKIIEDKLAGGYYIIGHQDLGYPEYASSAFVVKTDASGTSLWERSGLKNPSGFPNYYIYSDIEQMRDGQLLFADGRVNFNNTLRGSGFKMIMANSSYSSINWVWSYAQNYKSSCRAVSESFNISTQISDGVIGCGTTDIDQGKIMCVKADRTSGAIMWSRTYNFGGLKEGANDICQTEDGGYVLTGYSDQYLVLFKVDINGNLLWSQKLDIITGANATGIKILNVQDGAGYSILLGGNISGSSNKAFVLKRNAAGIINLVVSNLTSDITSLHSMQMRSNNTFMISGKLKNMGIEKTYISELSLSNIATTTTANEYNIQESRSTAVTSDNSFISIGNIFGNSIGDPTNQSFHVFKTKSNGLVNCLGITANFPMNSHTPLPISHSVIPSSSTYIYSKNFSPFPEAYTHETEIVCCYGAGADVNTYTIHLKCNERANLQSNCENSLTNWYDENGQPLHGLTTHTLSFIPDHSTIRTARQYYSNGCVRCEKTFNVIVDVPVCFSLPATICVNQPIVPTPTCDMSKANWHQWVVTELNGAWNNRVVKGSFPFGGPPQAGIDIKSLWNGFIPGKCYGISLDIQDSCGNNNTLYQFFCVPALIQNTITVTVCPLNGNTTRWFEPSQHCSGAYYTFLGNDSRDYAYGYPLSPGNYLLDCFDASGCQTGRTTVQVVPIPELPATTCTQTVYYCDVNPNLEGILPENCPDCYRDDPRVELLPLETETINGVVRYKRKIIDWDNCRQCDFSFEVIDKACDFNVAFNEVISTSYPFGITFFNTSSSGSGTAPCGTPQWIIDDLTAGVSFLYFGSAVNFTGQIQHEYQVCLSVSNCACGRACEKSFCKTFRIDDDGAHVSRLAQHSEEATSELLPANKGIVVKPNPGSGKFVLENSYGLRVYDQVLITDMNGKTVLKMENMVTGFEYDLSDLAKGVYVVKITTADGTKNTKLVLQ